jgi:hypothetical protein
MKDEGKAISSLSFIHPSSLLFEPSLQGGQYVLLLFRAEGLTFGNVVPFFEAGAAAGGRGVLCYEDGMVAHGRLLAIVGGLRGCEPLLDKVRGVLHDAFEPLLVQVLKLFAAQAEASAKG